MRRLLAATLVVATLVGGTVAFDAPLAGACSCAPASDAEYHAQADAVFMGQVAGYEAPDVPLSSLDPATWTFAVDRVYKGDVASDATVQSAVSGASCGLEIPRSGTFLVFAQREGDGLEANLCGGTRASGPQIDPAVFGDGRAVATPTGQGSDDGVPSHSSPAAVVAIGVVLALGAVALLVIELRRRRTG